MKWSGGTRPDDLAERDDLGQQREGQEHDGDDVAGACR